MTKKRARKSKRTSPKPRASRVGSGNSSAARHPKHKAREIRSIGSNSFVGWSIYPEQIPAMLKAMGDVIYDDVITSGDAPANCAKKALAAIGLVLPNTKVTNAGTSAPDSTKKD
jgi:hypothetical protein